MDADRIALLNDNLALRAALEPAEARADVAEAEVAVVHAQASDREALIAHLNLQIEKLRRQIYCPHSERTARLLDQMEPSAASDRRASRSRASAPRAGGRAGPHHLPAGGARLHKLSEDVTETLETIPRQWKVIQHVREKFTCRDCEKISQPPAPFHPTPRGWADQVGWR